MLLSDGEDTGGPDAVAAAELAAAAGVHIETVGVGTVEGTTIEVDGYQVATALNEELLTEVAATTTGSYHRAANARGARRRSTESLDLRITIQDELVELTGAAVGDRAAAPHDRRATDDQLVRTDPLMSLTWPWALAALLAFPLLLAFRWWMRRRRRREAVRVSSVTLIRAALPGRSLWRRRIPLWLFAAGLVVLGTGAARPQASVPVPVELHLDPAGDRRVRLDVLHRRRAQPADRRAGGRPRVRRGAGGRHPDRPGRLLRASPACWSSRPPTRRRCSTAIDTLRTSRGTAIGLAILASVDAIAEINPDVAADRGRAVGAGAGAEPPATTSPTPSSCSPTAATPRASTR